MTILWHASTSFQIIATSVPSTTTILTVPPGVGFFDSLGFNIPDGMVSYAVAIAAAPGHAGIGSGLGGAGIFQINFVDDLGTVWTDVQVPSQLFSNGGYAAGATNSGWGPNGGTVKFIFTNLNGDGREVINGVIAMSLSDGAIVEGEINGPVVPPTGTGDPGGGSGLTTGHVSANLDFRQWIRTVHTSQLITPLDACASHASVNLNRDTTLIDYTGAANWVNTERLTRYDASALSTAGSFFPTNSPATQETIVVTPLPTGATSMRSTIHTFTSGGTPPTQVQGLVEVRDSSHTLLTGGVGASATAQSSNGWNDSGSNEMLNLPAGAAEVAIVSNLTIGSGSGFTIEHDYTIEIWSNDASFYVLAAGIAHYTGTLPTVPPTLAAFDLVGPVTDTARGHWEVDEAVSVVAIVPTLQPNYVAMVG